MKVQEILLCVSLGLGVINFIINLFLIRRMKFNEYRMKNQMGQEQQKDGVIFCKKCSSKYSSALRKCPSCGAARK